MQARYFSWKPGYGAKIDAEVAHNELERIREENEGVLTADIVVVAAKPKDSPLHPQVYDLNQKEAAQAHYRSNASRLIRSLQIKFIDDIDESPEATRVESLRDNRDNEPVSVRAYHEAYKIPSDNGRRKGGYLPLEEALQNPQTREVVLATALAELASWRKKYATLSELAQIFRAMDEIAA